MSDSYEFAHISNSEKSISEAYLPRYRRVQKHDKKQNITPDFKSLHQQICQMVDRFSQISNNRMKIHQNQLIEAMKLENIEFIEDIKATITRYENLIREKSISAQLRAAQNQIQFYRYQSLKLFSDNNQLKEQIKQLLQQKQTLKLQLQCKSLTLTKLTTKLAITKKDAQQYKKIMNQSDMKIRHKVRLLRLSLVDQIERKSTTVQQNSEIKKSLSLSLQKSTQDPIQKNEVIRMPALSNGKSKEIKGSFWQVKKRNQSNFSPVNNMVSMRNTESLERVMMKTPKMKKIEQISRHRGKLFWDNSS